MELKKQEIK